MKLKPRIAIITEIVLLLSGISSSYGQGWQMQVGGSSETLYDVFFTDVNKGTAVGSGGILLQTTNGGASWYAKVSGTSSTLFGVYFFNTNIGYAVGANSVIIKTTDGGTTWVEIDSVFAGTLYGIYFSDANTGTVVGDNGTILHTTNGGISWIQQESGAIVSLRGVYFSDASRGVIVGLGKILHTTNGGTVWISKPSYNLYGVSFADANNGFAVGYNNKIYKTSDGGQSWTLQTFLGGVNFTAVASPTPSTAVAVGFQSSGSVDSAVVIRTTNGGKNWYEESITAGTALYSVSFPDTDVGYVVGGEKLIYKTNNGGGLYKVPLLSPVDGFLYQLQEMPLRWYSVPGALSYTILVSSDPSFLEFFLVLDQTVSDTLTLFPQMAIGSTYYWIVQLHSTVGDGPWSRVRSFTATEYAEHTIQEMQQVPLPWLLVADSLQYQNSSEWGLQATPYLTELVKMDAVCVVPLNVLYDPNDGAPAMLFYDVASDTAPWHGIIVKPSSSPAFNEFFKIKSGQEVLCGGGPKEEPSENMNSMTIYSPDDYVVEDSLQSMGRYVVKKITDFHRGSYTNGWTQFSTGEPYESSLVEFHNLSVTSYVNSSVGTVNLSDGLGNTISTSDMSVWFTLRSNKSPSSTFTIPPLGARIDTIRGIITTEPDDSGRYVYRIAPVFPGDIVYGAPKFGVISGKVVDDFNRDSTFNTSEPGIANWPVYISGKIQGTVFTDATGKFSVSGIDSGTYIITQGSLSGWTPTYPSQGSYVVTLGLNDTSNVNNFGNYFPWNVISGKVFDDLNENGIQDSTEPGMNHWLVHCYGNFSDSAWTDSTGAYIFRRVDAGLTTVSLDLKQSWEQIVPQMGASYSFDIQTYSKTYTGLQFSVLLIPQRVKITMTVHDSTNVNMRDVWWGERPGASYGIWGVDSQATNIDFSEGEFEVPPPTPGLFDARFVDPHNSLLKFGYGSWTDMRGYFSSSQVDTFKLTFSPGYFFGGDYPMTIIWPRQLINSSFVNTVMMIDSLGGIVNMKMQDSIVITNPAIRSMTIIASGPILPAPNLVTPSHLQPNKFLLAQNFPNPFNPITTIQYQIPKTSHVVLKIYDILGREVITLVDQQQQPGNKTITWDANSLASGIYFYRLIAGEFVAVKKMAVVR